MGSIENDQSTERRFGTLAVHAGAPHDPVTGAVIAPVRSRITSIAPELPLKLA
jgi:O-acetylhomoserine/O-acetylserine sulfhydrylase-like pyridoxal-dependent enzyme